jgi:hypothetical protein
MLAASMGIACLASLACLACLVSACRVHTSRDSKATAECWRVAEDTSVADHEAGKSPTDVMKVCGACCEKSGRSNVEPGSCSCGELGMDVLWN